MILEGILVATLVSVGTYLLSGARSSAYLLYFLAYIPFISLDVSDGGLTGEEGLGGANVLFKMSFRLFVTVGFCALALRRREALGQLFRPQSLPVLFFFLWALLGLPRAQAPLISLFRLGELLSFFLCGVVLFVDSARFHSPRDVARWHCLALLQLPLITLYFLVFHPEVVLYEPEDGIARLGYRFLNANTLGFSCAAVVLWATTELRERRSFTRTFFSERILPLVALVIALYALFEVHSRTAMIATVLGQLILWFPFTWKQAWRLPAFGVVCLAGLVFVLLSSGEIAQWFLRGEPVEGFTTGTGRTELWAALLEQQLPRAPLLGAGYLMLSDRGSFLLDMVEWNNAHNSYLFALISTGVPGFLALLAIAFTPWVLTFRRLFTSVYEERPFGILLFAIQTVILVSSITGFGICGYPNPAMLFHYAIYTYLVMHRPSRTRERSLRPLRPLANEAALAG